MELRDNASVRIKRLRGRLLDDMPYISVERARYYTEKWRTTRGSGLSRGERVALCMKHVYENMGMHIDPDDRIAGSWTEFFLGIPIDVERGLFNHVLAVELDPVKMAFFQAERAARFAAYMLSNYDPLTIMKTARDVRAMDAPVPSIGTTPMDKRRVNPYRIRHADKRELREKILPYWNGRSIADLLPKHFERADLYPKSLKNFAAALQASTSREVTIISSGAALGTWQGHLILDHDSVLRRGLLDMKREADDALLSDDLTGDQAAFLRSVSIALDGVIIYAKRLSQTIQNKLEAEKNPDRQAVLWAMLDDCLRVPLHPAATFRQAVQSFWTVKCATQLAMPFNVHAPGRLDQIFYPYYADDIAAGRTTPEQARELCEELFLKVMSHNMRPYSNFTGEFNQRYEGSEPVTLGGLTPDGRDAANELTYVMLEAAESSKASLNFVVRLHENSPEELYETVAGLHYRGTSSVSIMNDEVSMAAMVKHGFSEEDARGCAITGCVDLVAPGKTGGEGFSSLLLCRVLDITLRNGDARTLIGYLPDVGLKTGDPDTFSDFDQLVDAFLAQCAHLIERIAKAARVRDALYANLLPCPVISAFMGGCMEKKKDVTQGGAVYDLEGILIMSSIANAVDSLFVIKKLIFEQKQFTFRDLLRAIDNNYKGFENMHRKILGVEGLWGNGNAECDALARRVTTAIFEETYKYKTYKGGCVAPFINSMTSHTIDGRLSLATPDGRRAATPFAASCNPYNVEKNGPTGVLRSVAALDFSHVLGCAVNIRMHPSAIGVTPESRKKWTGLVRTYFKLGGEQLQPTIVSTEILRAAQKDPDKYRSIIVKVGGYSAYFTDLGREIQNEIISRTEHTM